MAGKKQNMAPMWKKMKNVDIDGPTSFLDHVYVLNVSEKRMKQLLNNTRCLNHVFLMEQRKNYRRWQRPHAQTVASSYDMEDMLKIVLNVTVKWQTRKWSNFTKSHVLSWMIIKSSRKNSNLSENIQKFALRLS